MAVEAKSNGDQFRRQMEIFRDRVGISLDRGFSRLGSRWDQAMQKRMRSGTTPPGVRKAPGLPTGRRTGRLARSLRAELIGAGGQLEGKGLAFGSRTPGEENYARIQEFGGKIEAKKTKYLAIPLPDAFRGRSVADPPRSYRDTFVFATTRGASFGGLYIVQEDKKGGLNFLFALRKEVTLSPRLGMISTMRAILKRHQRSTIVEALEDAAAHAFGATGGQSSLPS